MPEDRTHYCTKHLWHQAWESLGIPPEELDEVAEEREGGLGFAA